MYDKLNLLFTFFFNRMVELFRWALGGHLVQFPAQSRANAVFRPASLGIWPLSFANLWGQRSHSPSVSLFQCLAVLMEEKCCFLRSNPNLLAVLMVLPAGWSIPVLYWGQSKGAALWCSECRVKGINHFPWPPTYTSGTKAQCTVGLPCYFYPIAFDIFSSYFRLFPLGSTITKICGSLLRFIGHSWRAVAVTVWSERY